ncbi:MAG TPA: tetratricopeptide repeat protein [Candidatus Eisenbacteria bacterium]
MTNPIPLVSRLRRASAGLILILACAPVLARADALKDGRAALQAGRLDEALRLFEQSAGEGSAEGRCGVGQVWLKRRQYAKAMEAFQTAQKIDPNLALSYYGQARVYKEQEQCSQAVPLLQKATDLDRKFPEAQLDLAGCLTDLKQFGPAIDAANRGLNWGPKWRPKFLVALGNVEMARDSLRDAATYFTKAREESPEDPLTHRALADFYAKRGTFELAYPEYRAAVAIDSSDTELRFALAQALFYGKRYSDALDEYRTVVARDPEFAPGQLALGNLLYLSGKADPRRYAERFNEARPPLEKYSQLKPSDPRGWSLLGRTYYYLKMRDEALDAMNKAEQLGDKTKDMYTMRARVHTDRREYDQAMADYRRGEPEAEDMLRLAQIFVIQKNTTAADSIYRTIVAQDSTSAGARFALAELGKMRFRDGDYVGAVNLLQRRIALDPNADEAYYYLGLSYKELKQYPQALAALRQATVLADAKADRHFWLGLLYAQVDSVEAARHEMQRVLDLDTTASLQRGIALRQLGYYKLLDKDYPEAVRLLESAAGLIKDPASLGQTWVWIGQGYQNSGNRTKALEAYNRALQINANDAVALKSKQSLEKGAPKQGGAP